MDRPNKPPLWTKPALYLVGPAVDITVLFGDGIMSRTGNEGLATPRRLAFNPLHLFLGRAAGPDRGGPSGLPGRLGDRGSGSASLVAPSLEWHAERLRRPLLLSFPALLGLVLVLASVVFGGDWLKLRLEANRPLPSADTPNVLLIVLDTVRADRLSVYGYERPTRRAQRLARRGIRFDEALAAAPGHSLHTRAFSAVAGRMSSASSG